MQKVIIQLGTLTCPSCMQKIEHAVSQQPGVEQVKVLFNASKVKVNVQSGTDPAILKQAIEHLGYEVEAIKVKELV